MKKIYMKLTASLFGIVIALTMLIGVSYAWMTISGNPAVNGINVTIGGGRTILLAADLTETVINEEGEKVVVHYPGAFQNTLNVSQHSTYDYLTSLSGLNPVSTSDGIHWILPAYEEETGKLKDISEFTVDDTLENANTTKTEMGSYIYLDFWIVSPGSEYDIRVAADTKSREGSYLMELPGVTKGEDGVCRLSDTQGIVSSIARVGFLVNADTVSTEGMASYMSSKDYNDKYNSLLGVYPEKGEKTAGDTSFTIYEPNGTSHPLNPSRTGEYLITSPLSYAQGAGFAEAEIADRLTVQDTSSWKELNGGTQLEQIFQTAVTARQDLTAEEAENYFYNDYLQGQVGAYIKSGVFYRSAAELYASEQGETSGIQTAGASDDAVITTLKSNTPQRIRMYIWLEGQDPDCKNTASVAASRFALSVELAGATK